MISNFSFDEIQIIEYLFIPTLESWQFLVFHIAMLQDKMAKLVENDPPHFGQGLTLLRGPKVVLALLFIVILNMNFCTSKVNAHKTTRTTCLETLFFFGVQI